MFEVVTKDRPSGLWLNPNLYGEEPIQRFIQAIGVELEAEVEDRLLDVLSQNRNYGRNAIR